MKRSFDKKKHLANFNTIPFRFLILFFCLLLLFWSNASAQIKVRTLVDSIDQVTKQWAAEKVYLHTDKPYYNIGDTIWFKAYVLDRALLASTTKSGLLYVELYNDSAEVVRRVSIRLIAGVGYAQIPLSEKIFLSGGYTLRAYTNWMQNFGGAYFYERRLYLGMPQEDSWLVNSKFETSNAVKIDSLTGLLELLNLDKKSISFRDVEVTAYESNKVVFKEELRSTIDGILKFRTEIADLGKSGNLRLEIRDLKKDQPLRKLSLPIILNRKQNIDLQFLPEGGHLIAGLPSLIGFKAIAEDGKGIDVSGQITDTKGRIVSEFKSKHAGMGSFNLTPIAGEAYKAIITSPGAFDQQFNLPTVETEGIFLHVLNSPDKDTVLVDVLFTPKYNDTITPYYLIASVRNNVYYAQQLDVKKPNFVIPKKLFPSGILKVSLLKGFQVVSERITFIDHKDRLNIEFSADKRIYQKRDSIMLDVQVKDKQGNPVRGSFSVAVTDDYQVVKDKNGDFDIATQLLLTSELKGYVESPGYYFQEKNTDRWDALENLMLTQGWVGYPGDLLSPPEQTTFLAESELILKGKVRNLFNKPVNLAPVLISSQKPPFIGTTVTNELGEFQFANLPPVDSGSFFIQARTRGGHTKSFGSVELQKFIPAEVPDKTLDPMVPWYLNTDSIQLNYFRNNVVKKTVQGKQSGIMLKEVQIVSKKIIKNSQNRNGAGNADIVFNEQEIKESAILDLYELLKQKLPGFKVVSKEGFPTLLYNDHFVVLKIDGAALPMQLDLHPTVEDVIQEMKEFKIATFKGLEIMYSRKYTDRYGGAPTRVLPVMPGINGFRNTEKAKVENVLLGQNENAFHDSPPGSIDGRYSEWRYRKASKNGRDVNLLVIEITTGNGIGGFKNTRPDYVTYRPVPIVLSQKFYEPLYKGSDSPDESDHRATVFWKPDIITGSNGEFQLRFFNSGHSKKLSVVIHGADLEGFIGTGKLEIKMDH